VVRGEDTLLGKQVEVHADLVVLATAMAPVQEASELAQKIGFSYDKDGFFTEAHPKLRPVDTNTAGIFLAGCCQGPKDIPDTVAQACAAGSKVGALFSNDSLSTNPMISEVNTGICSGCLQCSRICPYKAISGKTVTERLHGQEISRVVADVNSGLCQGCGACVSECRSGALNLKGFSNEQLMAEVDAACL
ncbi:MAG: 4Fe-4S binding protein, partial [Clostridia bacterium]|nr:4Fe-4S binding protein [Clostridia bacterium]